MAVVISFSLTVQCVFAAWYNDVAYDYTQSDFAQWGVSSTIEAATAWAGAKTGAAIGSAVGPLGTFIGGALGAVAGYILNLGFNSLAEFLAAGHTEQELYDVENQYLTDNNLTVVGGGDSLTLYLASISTSTADLDKAVTNGYLKWWSLKNNTFSVKLGNTGNFKFPSAVYSNEFKVVQNGKYKVSAFTLIAPSVAPLSYRGYYLQKCVDGKWLNVFSYDYSGTYFENDYGLQSIRYQIGSTSLSFQSEFRYRFCFGLSPTSMYCGGGEYAGTEHSLVFPSIFLTSSSGGSTQAPATTRVGSAMQAINNYNTTNNTVNYYIGTSDANGKITNVYSPDLFNESTLKFTEPVTGTQYVCSNWNYAYTPSARGYYLDLAAGTYSYNGTDIRSIVLAYLDDALYIIGSDQELDDYTVDTYLADAVFVDKYDYVIATAKDDSPSGTTCNHVYTSSTTTAPTCTEQGVRRYTCTLCGHTRDEKVPATGHSWAVTETVDTETAENGDVTRAGYTLYTCSACGETYKQWSDTGQPGPPGGGSGSGSTDTGLLAWLAEFREWLDGKLDALFSAADAPIIARLDEILSALQSTSGSAACEHTYSQHMEQETTCTLPGLMISTCSKCGDSYSEIVDPLGHDWKCTSHVDAVTDPDTGEETSSAYDIYTCSRCGDTSEDHSGSGAPEQDYSNTTISRLVVKVFSKLGTFAGKLISFVVRLFDKAISSVDEVISKFNAYVEQISTFGGDYPAWLTGFWSIIPAELQVALTFAVVCMVLGVVGKKLFFS